MGLISTEVEVLLDGGNIKYYESLGYIIPRTEKIYKNKKGNIKDRRMTVTRGTKIKVKVSDLPLNSTVSVEVECDHCYTHKKTRYANYNDCVHGDDKYYCHSCAMKIFHSGSLHSNWNNNLSDKDRKDKRKYSEYTDFVKSVFARDNHTCQCCGKQKTNLVAHHLDGYNWCLEKRTDVTNGITLCSNCHGNFHSIYGQGNNTKEQFEEWMGNISIQLENYNDNLPVARKVFDYTENKIYENAMLWSEVHKSNLSYIYNCCNHTEMKRVQKKKDGTVTYHTAHNNTVQGHYLFWYDEYKNMTNEDLQAYFYKHRNRAFIPVICITTGEKFETISSASQCYKIDRDNITKCCNKQKEYCTTKDKLNMLKWMYLSDFEKLSKEEQERLLQKEGEIDG